MCRHARVVGIVAAVVLAALWAKADTFTNRETGQVVKGRLLGRVIKTGKQTLWLRMEEGGDRYLAAARWRVRREAKSNAATQEPVAQRRPAWKCWRIVNSQKAVVRVWNKPYLPSEKLDQIPGMDQYLFLVAEVDNRRGTCLCHWRDCPGHFRFLTAQNAVHSSLSAQGELRGLAESVLAREPRLLPLLNKLIVASGSRTFRPRSGRESIASTFFGGRRGHKLGERARRLILVPRALDPRTIERVSMRLALSTGRSGTVELKRVK